MTFPSTQSRAVAAILAFALTASMWLPTLAGGGQLRPAQSTIVVAAVAGDYAPVLM